MIMDATALASKYPENDDARGYGDHEGRHTRGSDFFHNTENTSRGHPSRDGTGLREVLEPGVREPAGPDTLE